MQSAATFEQLYQQSKYFSDQQLLQYFSDSLFEYVAIINANQQIVFNNKPFASFIKAHPNEIIGMRPGKTLQCSFAANPTGECGTSDLCSICGVYQAIKESNMGKPSEKECRINRDHSSDTIEMKVRATPITINNEAFTILAISDISNEKRRKALESVFFHDIMNTIGGLVGYSEFLVDGDMDDTKEIAAVIHSLAIELNEQIDSQREISRAEHNELVLHKSTLHSISVLTNIVTAYKRHRAANGKHLEVTSSSDDFIFVADETLLNRILGNLVKNAVEATMEGGCVTLGCKHRDDELRLWIHNTTAIPYDVQLQIFQRSFSTKGEGRGLGTYSTKLFVEKYLGGRVSFVSNEDDGTIFTVSLPLKKGKKTSFNNAVPVNVNSRLFP
jgi:K+-sensing histidine kinase KdpD